jgi:hypothetical protein
MKNMLRYYQSNDKLKPHDGCKELCHCLGFVSVVAHGPQLDIDVLNVYNACAQRQVKKNVLLILTV